MRKPVEPVRATRQELRRVDVSYYTLPAVIALFTPEEQPFVEFEYDGYHGIEAILYAPEPEEEFNKRVAAYKRDLAKYEQYLIDNTPEKKAAKAKARKEQAKLAKQAKLVKTIAEAQAELEKLRTA
jgi:hypothetical protein